MSHITKLKVEIKDLECLKLACESLGLELNENQKTYKWYGSQPKKCDHAISVAGNNKAYEVGVMKKDDIFEMEADFWNGGYGLEELAGSNCGKVMEAYGQEVAMKTATEFANAEGWSVDRSWDTETSETVIKLTKY